MAPSAEPGLIARPRLIDSTMSGFARVCCTEKSQIPSITRAGGCGRTRVRRLSRLQPWASNKGKDVRSALEKAAEAWFALQHVLMDRDTVTGARSPRQP